ncbi:transcriptional regulator, GntR family with aminotransferase domain [Methylocella silvestris BL2]|uniref:Transcriptional regulator, GntR family with aminotransferase domain n=1 Tax=Methylocella silvestris (strain DSM 15510 / CIP 108128 / LMG 27833 / NCIMB 13906 / BL2) TaxID=395965 RepID=B8EPS8_METSB|nr:PLP-dependent aminotransferase family protein [Methylocella silvestris]ACK50932.1 transcriptional regulator, GntR family with aminotransferase domain [Methylocella silvestris BL2]
MPDWTPDLTGSDKPRYLAIADLIAEDLRSGRLSIGDRLPPQRQLAARLGVDFTTVARGYVEAKKRGLVESRVGRGTFVCAPPRQAPPPPRPARSDFVDLSMNLPPEPDDPALIARMQDGVAEVSRDLVSLLRYQAFGGSPADKDAASAWLGRRSLVPSQDRLFVTPGAHPALLGIFSILAAPGDVVLCEELTYPGMRAIAAQLRLKLVGLPMDADGVDPDAFKSSCETLKPKAIYLNPTLHNPTTLTIPATRRVAIAAVARRYNVPIVEDDAYGFIPTQGQPPFAAIAPDLTWHVAGLAKCIGAGLRAAYVVAPDARSGWPFAAAMRAANVMASPLTAAIATRWIEDGAADTILRFIRAETAARQQLAADILPKGSFRSDRLSFNLWMELPKPWTRSAFIGHMGSTRIGVVASDAFTVGGDPIEAIRICIGGPTGREEIRSALEYIAHALAQSPAHALQFL